MSLTVVPVVSVTLVVLTCLSWKVLSVLSYPLGIVSVISASPSVREVVPPAAVVTSSVLELVILALPVQPVVVKDWLVDVPLLLDASVLCTR